MGSDQLWQYPPRRQTSNVAPSDYDGDLISRKIILALPAVRLFGMYR
jgi:hypothetical protein